MSWDATVLEGDTLAMWIFLELNGIREGRVEDWVQNSRLVKL